ncbi:hypothetical protein Tco_1460212 [Tanacetum coccineum]
MSSDSASSEVTHTSISSHGDPLAWVVDFFGLQEPDSPEAAPASPDYVPGPEEPEQAPLSPYYVSRPEYPEYLAPSDEEDSEDSPVDYPADRGDADDDDSSDNDEEEEALEEEEHLALVDSVVAPVVDHVPSFMKTEPFETDEFAATPPSPPAYCTTAKISIRPEVPMPFPSKEEVERLLALPPPPPSPLISLSPPSAEERLARCLAAHALPSSLLLIVPHPYGSPNHVRAPPGFRATMGRLRASSPSTTSITTITTSTIITTFTTTVDRREDIPKAELQPHKRLFLTALSSRYEVGRVRLLLLDLLEVDPTEAVEDVAPMTLEGQTQLFQRVDGLVEDRQFHYETARLLDQEALVSREAWAHSVGLSSAVHYELQAYRAHTQMQDYRITSQESLMMTLIAQVSSL